MAVKTASASIKWAIEVYAFDSPVPSKDQFSKGAAYPSVILGAASAADEINQYIKEITALGSVNSDSASIPVALGVTNIIIHRDKTSPAGKCGFQLAGRAHKDIYPGVWVVISSFDGLSRLVRFVGQIQSITPQYSIDPMGLMTLRTAVEVREWSSILLSEVRYDMYSWQQMLLSTKSGIGALANAADLLKFNPENLQKLTSEIFNPFELAQIFLILIGAMNKEDEWNRIGKMSDEGKLGSFSKIALTAPNIPMGVLKRLSPKPDGLYWPGKIMGSQDSANPFSQGFSQCVFGQQGSSGVYNDGNWNGIFDKSMTIKSYKDLVKAHAQDNKQLPMTQGPATLCQLGLPVWALITRFCDPAIFEYYTDIWYEVGETPDDIVARPVIVMRDKPFLLKMLKEQELWADLSTWTEYDALPRYSLDNTYISGFSLTSTFLNSPNYLRVNYHLTGADDKVSSAPAAILGKARLDPEMDRFGGKANFMETLFLGYAYDSQKNQGTSIDYVSWYDQLLSLSKCWYAFDYRMPRGSLRVKDGNHPISVGFNVQFQFGDYKIVGHVESIDIMHEVQENGLATTNLQLGLSKIVQQGDKNLDFIPVEVLGSLPWAPYQASGYTAFGASTTDVSTGKLLDIAKDFVGLA